MITASGILFLTKSRKALFLKRGRGSDHPLEWSVPGGQQEDKETIEQCAVRETVEEAGQCPEGPRMVLTRSIARAEPQPVDAGVNAAGASSGGPSASLPSEDVDFTTFIQPVDEEFPVTLNYESEGYAWVSVDTPPEPLHPGARLALRRLSADELDIAEMIRDGELMSPQRYDNVWLFAIRITGTGAAYRHNLNEYAWRDPELYLNERFLARCAGLSVIWEHPPEATMDSKEFSRRVIGSAFVPFIPGPAFLAANPKARADDVWAVVKVYDDAAAKEMIDNDLSTSPSVAFRDPSVNSRLTLDDGSALLIEGKPSLLDHIAICAQGVWDKEGAPTGVINDSVGDIEMVDKTDEEKKADAAEKERADNDVLNKLADAVGALCKRMDSLESMKDSRKDADEEKKADAEDKEEAEEKKADKRKDSDKEDKEEAEPVVADKRKDADEEKKADAEDKEEAEEKKADKRKDAEEEKEEKMDKKADASAGRLQELERELAALKRQIPRSTSDADYAAMAQIQARADAVYRVLNDSAPRPLQGEDALAYRRRLAMELKGHTTNHKNVNLHSVFDDATLSYMEEQIYADAVATARSPSRIGLGNLVSNTYEQGGHQITDHHGDPLNWMGPIAGNSQRVTAFNDNVGRR